MSHSVDKGMISTYNAPVRMFSGGIDMAVKLSVNLSDEAATTLKDLAEKNGVTVTEQLRRSIATEMWRENIEANRGKVLVEDASGRVREVEFQR